jgi:hypothetical protein
LLHIIAVKDKVLSEKLHVAEAVLAGREHFVDTLDNIIGDHTWNALYILGCQVFGFEGTCSLKHIDTSSEISLRNIHEWLEYIFVGPFDTLSVTYQFESLNLSLAGDGWKAELDTAASQWIYYFTDVVADDAETRRRGILLNDSAERCLRIDSHRVGLIKNANL